ncbi:hypothetical protein QU487_13170 [Crenobacter sp. SG2305]|uniref:hypothetical protein n=1 Tax=Crenobacter oryzisoli TaxID=3056844 RepID=UPI0025AB519C|nr:hypothetical protein [Crenobacter sp. SG2305]MDN0083697.1 hypothetical protein [Crenobacter sp. SG2305]
MLSFLQRIRSKFGKSNVQVATAPSRNQSSSPISVSYNDQGVCLSFEGQGNQFVTWAEIDLIAIRIEDEFLPFPYWYVGNKDNLLRISNDVIGGKKLFFDGFCEHITGYKSDETFKIIIEASAAMEGSFIVWRAANAAT